MRRLPRAAAVAVVIFAGLAVTHTPGVQAHAGAASNQVTQFTSGAQVNAYLTKAHFNGYILLVRHGRVILSKGYGLANIEYTLPNTLQTPWPMLGIEDFMVAMAALKLQEEGKLRVQNKLCTYISPCPNAWRPITLKELLTGTSGMTSGGVDLLAGQNPMEFSIKACEVNPLQSAPGTLSNDSDCNRLFLSLVLAKVTHQTFATVMQQTIFGPAGMTSTSVVTGVSPRSAQGYNHGVINAQVNVKGFPLIYASVQDVLRLDQALLAGKIISRASRTALFTSRINVNPQGSPVYHGYGTYVIKANRFPSPSTVRAKPGQVLPMKTNKIVFQSGGSTESGFITDNFVSPNDGTIAIWMNNDNGLFNFAADNRFTDRTVKLLWAR